MPPEHRSLWSDGPSEDDHHAWLDPERTTESSVADAPAPAPTREHRASRAGTPGGPAGPTPAQQRRRRRSLVGVALLAAVALLVGGIAIGQQYVGTRTVEKSVVNGPTAAGPLKAAYEATHDGVVRVSTSTGNGTGWVYDDRGTIVTNNHVVSEGSGIKVRFGEGADVPAKLLGTDISSDLAVLRVDPKDVEKLVPLPVADSDKVQTGDPVLAIGYPLGLDQTATAGIISGVGRQIQAQNNFSIDKVLQTDAPINPGNSGGPLLDAKGRVVGVNSQIATTGAGGGSVGIGFAIPSNTVKSVVPTLENGGKVQHAYLGVQMGDLQGVTGAAVGVVTPGGPAAKAGLRSVTPTGNAGGTPNGDVIVGIGGKPVERADDVTKLVNEHKPGDTVDVEVSRNGKRQTIKVTLGNRPATAASSSPTTTTPNSPNSPNSPSLPGTP